MEIKTVLFNPFSGTLTIKDFILGNPKGYSSPYALKLSHLHVDVGMTTLFSKKLLVERVEVKGVELNYETSVLSNNIKDIQQNVERVAGKVEKAEKKGDAPGKPLQVDYLELRGITAWVIVKGSKVVQAPLPVAPIVMTNLGTGEEGVSSVMVVNDVLVSMLTSVTRLIGADAAFKSFGDLFTGKSGKDKK